MSPATSAPIPEILDESQTTKQEGKLDLFRGYGGSANQAVEDYSDSQTCSTFESAASTHFRLEDAPARTRWEKQKWERLQRWQRGTKPNWDGYGMDQRQSQSQRDNILFKKTQAKCLSDACDLNCKEKEIVVSGSTRLDYVKFGAHSDIWKGILGVMAVVVENRRPQYGADFELASLHRQDAFRELMDFIGLDYTGLNTVKKEVRDQLTWISEVG
ncbi:hypothetical protein [Halorarius halobius]|uniref:hypothetical protein n=1 Tax=Halorarius halobius TaxID=2962671 RepID=UPI0020CECFAA|nr:hypothetical protein [Halorarius halobius]